MFKNMIGPVQAWLLSQKRCVGCGMPLQKALKQQGGKAICKCGRIYIYESESNKYRRALLTEVE